jgi:hypothetical protein
MSANNLNLYRNANEAHAIGNKNPPNMSRISDSLLTAASPGSFSLLDNTKTNKDSSDTAVAACRSYQDIDGLRKLGKEQVNKTYYDPRCGWRYKPSTGMYPEISQGALGTAEGPTFGQAGSPDEVADGTQWFWNLEDAEKKISSAICKNANNCKQLALLGRYSNVCGYCKTTGAIIPVVGNTAKYPDNKTAFGLGCLKKDIITASSAPCPATESFTNFRSGNLKEAFNIREGFGSLDDLNNCMETPLTRDCVIKAAQNAGCSSDGALIQSLYNATDSSASYDSKLKGNSAYNSYNAYMPFTNGLLNDGSVTSIGVALDDFGRLMANTQSQTPKVSLAARDLCIRAGEFDNYDFCMEMRLDAIINSTNISCVQKIWGLFGGTKQGTRMPTLDIWNGQSYITFLISQIPTLIHLNSDDKNLNSRAIKDFIGTDSAIKTDIQNLPMDENTRGAETVWFDLGDISKNNSPVIILKCDLRLMKDKSSQNGYVLPFIGSSQELISKYNLHNENNKAYSSAFEIRMPNNKATNANFFITTDDGFVLSKNENPFENAGKGPAWGSWRYQGPSSYHSPSYTINRGQPNIFVTKWFQGYGQAVSQFWIHLTETGWQTGGSSPNVYLTQEPLAPWMQYEICDRPNSGYGRSVGFFEKRWNGASAIDTYGKSLPSFDTTSKSVVFQTNSKLRETVPGKKGYMSFVSNSYWHTNSYFHFNAFKTLTILIRPTANLANGGMASVFHHCNFNGYSAGMYLKNEGGQYRLSYGTSQGQFQSVHQVRMNEWNLIIIQYVGDDSGVRKITVAVESLPFLIPSSKEYSDYWRYVLLQKLSSVRGSVAGSVVIGNPRVEPLPNSGMLIMGALNSNIYPDCKPTVPSFTGDVAWIHGFRNYLDTETVLKNEIMQTWVSRWAIPNLSNDPKV